MNTPEKPAPTDDDMTRLSGWDALLDDLFGLNVRAVTTLAAAVTRPARLFTAARDPDWNGKYTPSLRLVFTIIAATVVLRFLWADDNSPLIASMVDYLSTVPPQDLPVQNVTEAARMLMSQVLILFPFTYFLCHFLASLLVRIWGKGTPAPVRIRLYFVALLPALTFGLLQTVPYSFVPAELLDAVTFAGFAIAMLLYAATIYFGLKPVYATGGRAWRAGLFALVAVTTDLVIAMVTFTLAFVLMYV